MSEQSNRRHQFIVNQGFQYKTMVYLAILVLVTVVLSHGLAWVAAKWLGSKQASTQITQTLQSALPQALSWDLLWIPALITIFLATILALFFGLHYSHRIAGPLFNLKRMLDRVGSGDLGTEMHIRAHDEFHDVEATFNQMVWGLSLRLAQVSRAAEELPAPHKSKLQKILAEAFPNSGTEKKVPDQAQR